MFKYLKKASGDEADIGWNFGKFLVGKDGSVIKRQVLLAEHGVVSQLQWQTLGPHLMPAHSRRRAHTGSKLPSGLV